MRYTVYKLHLTSGESYIGCTKNLGQRLFEHSELHNRTWNKAERLHSTTDSKEASRLEAEETRADPKAINSLSCPYHATLNRSKSINKMTPIEILKEFGDIE